VRAAAQSSSAARSLLRYSLDLRAGDWTARDIFAEDERVIDASDSSWRIAQIPIAHWEDEQYGMAIRILLKTDKQATIIVLNRIGLMVKACGKQ
jgi:hypothetical protein